MPSCFSCSASPPVTSSLAELRAVSQPLPLAEGRIDLATRKPNQRSSIYYSEADGRWHGWVVMGVRDDGSPYRRHRKGRTEAEVTRKVQELEANRSDGHAEKPGRPLTVAAWFDTWLTTIAPRTVSQSTIDSTYEPKVRRWIIPRLGRHRLDQLQPEHLDAFYAWLVRQGLKPNTVGRADPPDRLPRAEDRLETRQDR